MMTANLSHMVRCTNLENKHVHDVYKKTAHHFIDAQYRAWPRVRQFLQDQEPGSLVADVGCGHGRYLHINKSIFKLGSDYSEPLVGMAGQRGHEVLVCDNLHMPYRDSCCDAVISIGVIHHLTTNRRRTQAVRELARILRPGGKIMIYVWAMEQNRRKFGSQDVLVPWHLKKSADGDPQQVEKEQDDTNSRCDEGNAQTKSGKSHHASSVLNHARLDNTINTRMPEKIDDTVSCDENIKYKATSQDMTHDQLNSEVDLTNDKQNVTSSLWSDSSGGISSSPKRNIPSWVKLRFRNLFKSVENENKADPKGISHAIAKDHQYRQLIQKIMEEDAELLKIHRPILEHSMSAPEIEGFAVREFPQSSRGSLSKHMSLEAKHPTLRSSDGELNSRVCLARTHSVSTQSTSSSFSSVNGSMCGSSVHSDSSSYVYVPSDDMGGVLSFQDKQEDSIYKDASSGALIMQSSQMSKIPGCQRQCDFLQQCKHGSCHRVCCIRPAKINNQSSKDRSSEDFKEIQTTMCISNNSSSSVHTQVSKASGSDITIDTDADDWDQATSTVVQSMQGKVDIITNEPTTDLPAEAKREWYGNRHDDANVSSDTPSRSSLECDESSLLWREESYCDTSFNTKCQFETSCSQAESLGYLANGHESRFLQCADAQTANSINDLSENGNCTNSLDTSTEKVPAVNSCADQDGKVSDSEDTYKRFYHVFRQGELVQLIERYVDCLEVVDTFYDHANWCVIAEKVHVWKI